MSPIMQAITMQRLKEQEEYGSLFATTHLRWSGEKLSQTTSPGK
jgi:hypothetical protein